MWYNDQMGRISKKVLVHREEARRYYAAHKEERLAYQIKYNEKHKIEISKKKRAFRKKHPILTARRKKEDYKKHRSKRLDAVKVYNDKHRKKRAENSREWRRLHPRKTKAHRLISKHNYRARLMDADGSFTFREFRNLCKKYNCSCLCCGKTERQLFRLKRILVPDHVKPISKGGSNFIENIQPLCHPVLGGRGGCNSHKHAKEIDYRNGILAKYLMGLYKGV
jgi:hypothetical protein